MKKLSYEELLGQINNCSITYLPALLAFVIRVCIKKKVFKEDKGLTDFVGSQYAKYKEYENGVSKVPSD